MKQDDLRSSRIASGSGRKETLIPHIAEEVVGSVDAAEGERKDVDCL